MTNQILTTFTAEELNSMIVLAVNSALNNHQLHQNPNNDNEVLMTLSDVAIWLKKSKVTIHKWKKNGVIPFHRISNKIYFKRNEVLESLQKSKIAGL